MISWMQLLFISLIFLGVVSNAQTFEADFVEKVVEAKSPSTNMTQARGEILTTGLDQVLHPLIRGLVGESAFNKNKSLIQTKVIRNYSRFIPTLRTSDLVQKDAEYIQTLTFKISINDLRAILAENGLLQEGTGVPVLLPVVRIEDRMRGQKYSWWTGSSTSAPEAEKMARLLEETLSDAFLKNSFMSLRPIRFEWSGFVPENLRYESPDKKELAKFASALGAQIVIIGEMTMQAQEAGKELQLQIRIEAIHGQTGRTVGEVVRVLKFENKGAAGVDPHRVSSQLQEVAADLSLQVFEASQRGTLSAESYRLTLAGHLNSKQAENFKEQLRSLVPEIRSIKERKISFEERSFDVESTDKLESLSEKLKKAGFTGGFKVKNVDFNADKNEIRMSMEN